MEIQKIFSSYDDYGYEDERLYSVLMSEEELSWFSDTKKRLDLMDRLNLASTKILPKKVNEKFENHFEKSSKTVPIYNKERDSKLSDIFKVRNGKMSKEEFIEKYGK